jgi:hypothetical protein
MHQHNREQDSANYSEHDFSGCSHDAVIRIYDEAGNVIGTHGDFKM